jgi:putative ABC transport system substrate-binding protein
VGGLAGIGVSAAELALVNGCGLLPVTTQPRLARIGNIWPGSPLVTNLEVAWRDGLRDAGWIEGKNLVIDARSYEGDPERIPALVDDLVALGPDVLFGGSTAYAQACKRATDSIPIVVANVTDPVGTGLIASFASPGGNLTGTARTAGSSLGPKLLDLLRQLVRGLGRVAVVFTTLNPPDVIEWQAIQTAAQSVGLDAQAVAIATLDDAERALETALTGQPQALILALESRPRTGL